MIRHVVAAMLLLVASGCGLSSTAGRVTTPEGVHPGAAVGPGERPNEATCQARIRADIAGALSVRAAFASPDHWALPIAVDEATARAAAEDPTSDTSTFGIPVLADELAAIQASAIEVVPRDALQARMLADPGRYGTLWLDAGVVVAVLGRDAADALRCFEPRDLPVRYVEAGWSLATLDALHDRIAGDWRSGVLMKDGIDVRMVGQPIHDDVQVIEVTVHGLTPAIADELRRRYGDPVVVVEGEGAQPA
jgi:hypothetical protein